MIPPILSPSPSRSDTGARSLAPPWGRWRRAPLLAALLALLGGAFVLSAAATAAEPGDESPWKALGTWETLANADDISAILRRDAEIWVASASGGVARWAEDGTELRRYRAPQDGLPCNDVRDILDWGGYLWFATCDGLAVYDPRADRFRAVSADLASPRATSLAADGQGRLWVASEPDWDPYLELEGKEAPGGWTGGGLAFTQDGETWQRYDAETGLPSNHATDLVAWQGALWVATLPYPSWQPPTIDPDGGVVPGQWVELGGGVARFDDGGFQAWDGETSTELGNSVVALVAAEDALWAGTRGRGLVAWSGGQWQGLRDCGDEARCIQDNFVTALAAAGDGALFVATSRFNGRGTGVAILDDGGTPGEPVDDAWMVLRGESAPPGSLVRALLPDDDAGLWIGSSELDPEGRRHGRGLSRLLEDRRTLQSWRGAAIGAGAPVDNDVTALARNPVTGELWVGTARDGISVRDPAGAWRHYSRESTRGGLASDGIADIEIGEDGTVWVAGQQLTYDARERAWTDGGLSRFDGERWTRLSADDGLPADHLSALALDGRGTLWVGTGGTDRGPKEHAYRGWGLAAVDTASLTWQRTFTFPQLPSNNVTDLAVLGDRLYVSTAYFFYVDPRPGGAQFSTGGGLAVHDLAGGGWTTYGPDEGLTVALRGRGASSSRELLDLRSVWVDDDATIWLGGQAYPEAEFEPELLPDAVVDRVTGSSVETQRFARAGGTFVLRRDEAGFLWAGTQREGLRIRTEDGDWIPGPGGLPDAPVTDFAFDEAGLWVATAGFGLARLVPPAAPSPTPDPGPSPTQDPEPRPTSATPMPDPGGPPGAVILRAPYRTYLPVTKREFYPTIVTLPARRER